MEKIEEKLIPVVYKCEVCGFGAAHSKFKDSVCPICFEKFLNENKVFKLKTIFTRKITYRDENGDFHDELLDN